MTPLRVLLMDVSHVTLDTTVDMLEYPLGLLYLGTVLTHTYGDRVAVRIESYEHKADGLARAGALIRAWSPDLLGLRSLTMGRGPLHEVARLAKHDLVERVDVIEVDRDSTGSAGEHRAVRLAEVPLLQARDPQRLEDVPREPRQLGPGVDENRPQQPPFPWANGVLDLNIHAEGPHASRNTAIGPPLHRYHFNAFLISSNAATPGPASICGPPPSAGPPPFHPTFLVFLFMKSIRMYCPSVIVLVK